MLDIHGAACPDDHAGRGRAQGPGNGRGGKENCSKNAGVLNQKADVRYDSAKREKIRNVYFRASLANNQLVPVARPVVGGRVVRGRDCWG